MKTYFLHWLINPWIPSIQFKKIIVPWHLLNTIVARSQISLAAIFRDSVRPVIDYDESEITD